MNMHFIYENTNLFSDQNLEKGKKETFEETLFFDKEFGFLENLKMHVVKKQKTPFKRHLLVNDIGHEGDFETC